jgi:pimeloyl-ACP methyl ester carboxylesterase
VLWTTITIVAAIVVSLAAMVVLVWWQQERIIFQPPRPVPALDLDSDCARLSYEAADGQPLLALVVRPAHRGHDQLRGGPRGLLLAFHGNADLAIWMVPWAREVVRRTGHTVMLAEYRGYGGLSGSPTYERARLDARAAHEQASPFTSARAMARFVVWRPVLATWRLISRVHYDTLARVAALEIPVWVAHGTSDLVVPARMGQEVFAAARVKGELLLVRGAGHNDVAITGGAEYWGWIERALG